jgi:hypothetical protein
MEHREETRGKATLYANAYADFPPKRLRSNFKNTECL